LGISLSFPALGVADVEPPRGDGEARDGPAAGPRAAVGAVRRPPPPAARVADDAVADGDEDEGRVGRRRDGDDGGPVRAEAPRAGQGRARRAAARASPPQHLDVAGRGRRDDDRGSVGLRGVRRLRPDVAATAIGRRDASAARRGPDEGTRRVQKRAETTSMRPGEGRGSVGAPRKRRSNAARPPADAAAAVTGPPRRSSPTTASDDGNHVRVTWRARTAATRAPVSETTRATRARRAARPTAATRARARSAGRSPRGSDASEQPAATTSIRPSSRARRSPAGTPRGRRSGAARARADGLEDAPVAPEPRHVLVARGERAPRREPAEHGELEGDAAPLRGDGVREEPALPVGLLREAVELDLPLPAVRLDGERAGGAAAEEVRHGDAQRRGVGLGRRGRRGRVVAAAAPPRAAAHGEPEDVELGPGERAARGDVVVVRQGLELGEEGDLVDRDEDVAERERVGERLRATRAFDATSARATVAARALARGPAETSPRGRDSSERGPSGASTATRPSSSVPTSGRGASNRRSIRARRGAVAPRAVAPPSARPRSASHRRSRSRSAPSKPRRPGGSARSTRSAWRSARNRGASRGAPSGGGRSRRKRARCRVRRKPRPKRSKRCHAARTSSTWSIATQGWRLFVRSYA